MPGDARKIGHGRADQVEDELPLQQADKSWEELEAAVLNRYDRMDGFRGDVAGRREGVHLEAPRRASA
jgi:hypothetical protein